MEPSCSGYSSKNEDGNQKPSVDNLLKREQSLSPGKVNNGKESLDATPELIDELEREDYEEENRLIQKCSESLLQHHLSKALSESQAESALVSQSSSSDREKIGALEGNSSSNDELECEERIDVSLTSQNISKELCDPSKPTSSKNEVENVDKCDECNHLDGDSNDHQRDEIVNDEDCNNIQLNKKTLQAKEFPQKKTSPKVRSKKRRSSSPSESLQVYSSYLKQLSNDDWEVDELESCTCSDINNSVRMKKRKQESTPDAVVEKKKCVDTVQNRSLSPIDPGSKNLQPWINEFLSWPHQERMQALDALVNNSTATEVRHMMETIEPLFQRDFISLLPREVALTLLRYLSAKDLRVAAQTCRYWRLMCDDNLLWKEQCRRIGLTRLRHHRSPVACSSPYKAAYMHQYSIENRWMTSPVNTPIIMKGHDDHVITCLQFSGNRILSGSDDTTLKVWSATSGRCIRTLIGHTGGVWSSQMVGRLAVSGSTDRTLKVWDATTGRCLQTFTGHTSTVRCMHMHGNVVVSGSRDATLRVWSLDTGNCLKVLIGHLAAVRCVQYDGKYVVSGAYDYFVKVWNPTTGECIHTLAGHTNRVYSLQFDGTHIVSGSLDTSIRVWDVESGQLKHTLIGHQSLTSGMELDSNILVSGNADSTVKVWDITTGQCLHTLSGPNKHQSAVTCLQATKRFVITSSDDGTVKLWDLRTGEFIRNLVELGSGGSGGVIWRIKASQTKLICAVGSRNGTEETKLMVLDFDIPGTCQKCHR